MKLTTLFFMLSLFVFSTVKSSNRKFIIAFDKPIENIETTKAIIEKCTGILSVKYCKEANAFLLEVDEVAYKKMELLELYVRPDIEKTTKNKFYFSDLSNPHFTNINCK